MKDHPLQTELEAFAQGNLPERQSSSIVLHLLQGCVQCRALVAPYISSLSLKYKKDFPQVVEAADPYDHMLDRVFARVRQQATLLQKEKTKSQEALSLLEAEGIDGLMRAPKRLRGLAGYFALLERSWALRHDDPARMVEYSRWATLIARNLDTVAYGEKVVNDLQCRAWAELGNALRVSDNLDDADEAFGWAFDYFQKGTQDDLLQARLFDLQASLHSDRRRFTLACAALDVVYTIYRRHREIHLAGRTLITKGVCAGYAGDADEAVKLTRQGLELIDPRRDPSLAFTAIHNLGWWLMEGGHLREARIALSPNRWRVHEAGGRLNLLKALWLDGRISAGMGELDRAERDLRKVKEQFSEIEKHYHASIAALDLAAVLLRQGRPEEAWSLGIEAAEVFASLRIQRETMGTVLLLRKACEMRKATAVFLESIANFLRRIEGDPNARFEPQV